MIAYLTLVGALIAITMNREPKDPFARFHTRQAFGLHLGFHGIALFLSTSFNLYALYVLYAIYILLVAYGLFTAGQGEARPIPLIGPLFQKWFTFIS